MSKIGTQFTSFGDSHWFAHSFARSRTYSLRAPEMKLHFMSHIPYSDFFQPQWSGLKTESGLDAFLVINLSRIMIIEIWMEMIFAAIKVVGLKRKWKIRARRFITLTRFNCNESFSRFHDRGFYFREEMMRWRKGGKREEMGNRGLWIKQDQVEELTRDIYYC